MQSLFLRLNVRKAAGPDNIGGRLLRECAWQLSEVFCKIFNWSLDECSVPSVWKKSTICPVPKKNSPSCLNDYRPVALTSIVMKCFERIVLKHLLSFTAHNMDPFQFAYKPHRGTDDAVLTLLHNAFLHVNETGSFVRILFVDFSSAFNTIQPHLLALKLLNLNVDSKLILWLISFLVGRTQSVCFQSAVSVPKSTSTGSPQGTVLSPALFTLYTDDCRGTETTPVIKYSDDSAIEDLSNSDEVYFSQVERFCAWCKEHYLNLNVSKTKELLIDFRKSPSSVPDLVIDGEKVERVSDFKYLGVIVDENLDFKRNTVSIHKKCQPRIYCLQKLRNIGVSREILQSYYQCCVQSFLTYSFICWFGSLTVHDKNVLNGIVNVCSKIVGMRQTSLNDLYERRAVKKGRQIANDASHVLVRNYELLPSGRRYRTFRVKARAAKTFIPRSIQLLNK